MVIRILILEGIGQALNPGLDLFKTCDEGPELVVRHMILTFELYVYRALSMLRSLGAQSALNQLHEDRKAMMEKESDIEGMTRGDEMDVTGG